MCSTDFDDPDRGEWGSEGPGTETAEFWDQWCPVHNRTMVDATEAEATVRLLER